MKRKLFFALGVAAFALGGIALSKTTQSTDILSVAQIENIEALASGEGSSPVCTGPKPAGWCLCENTNPCNDLYGCQ